jgi:hypothetical protein
MTMQYTTSAFRFHVQEHGNGWAYTVTDQTTGENFFVQDEAADALQQESDDFANEDVLAQYMEAMGE